MMDALPPEAPSLVTVESSASRAPLFMLGFFAFGSSTDLDRLDAASRGTGLVSQRLPTEGNGPEQGVLFPPGSDRTTALNLFRRARDGEFGRLRVEVLIVPVAAAADGIDFDTEARVYPATIVADPNR